MYSKRVRQYNNMRSLPDCLSFLSVNDNTVKKLTKNGLIARQAAVIHFLQSRLNQDNRRRALYQQENDVSADHIDPKEHDNLIRELESTRLERGRLEYQLHNNEHMMHRYQAELATLRRTTIPNHQRSLKAAEVTIQLERDTVRRHIAVLERYRAKFGDIDGSRRGMEDSD
ncbi:hypothetical protein KIPB_010838 [Kipferlia bialata]|uniref:Uncharacterized protein n=1 Tax=Kipferlia bialata TaxID=797122 RepID=A0A9K3D4A4_9EUKA|nr:hypothetical protein KIPB_010838 [Kipferlia bialata]|eukprot:g10838.t1